MAIPPTWLKKLKELSLSEGIILGLVPVVAYYLSFRFEEGFFSYFGAPTIFIDVGFTTLVICGGAALAFLGIIAQLVNGFVAFDFRVVDEKTSWLKILGFALGHAVILYLVFWLLLGWKKGLGMPILIFIMIFTYGFGRKKPQSGTEYMTEITAFLVYIAVAIQLCWAAGYFYASVQLNYEVMTDQTNTFVLRRNGESVVTGTYDPQTRTVAKHFKLVDIKDTLFEKRLIGPLKAKDASALPVNPVFSP